MDTFETFTGLPQWKPPATPEAAGLPSDGEVLVALKRSVARAADPWPEVQNHVAGDGNYDAGERRSPYLCTVQNVGAVAHKLANT